LTIWYRRPLRIIAIAACAALGIYLLVLGGAALDSFDRTNGGQIAVVRNGGPLDNHKIRQIIDPGSGLTHVGLFSETHKYPAQQRFYTITSNAKEGDRAGVDIVQVPSRDGVEMGIEGTLYFQLNLDHKVLRDFDDKFGTRKFQSPADGKYYAAYGGDKGWSAFLDTIIRPVIDNDLREQINTFSCADLVSSCALVQLGANGQAAATATLSARSSNGNIAKVQNAINSSLAADLKSTLGDQFLTGLRFNLVRITLPANVQTAVNNAQAAFANITEAQAKVQQAKADAEANRQRQAGYAACPACAQIDELKAIPPNVTTYAPGAGVAVSTGH
jgi:regulator of protease activity HflC (stomatin/prohibitin superfamily)